MMMAKIRFRILEKKYKGRVSTSEEVSVNFPKDLHELLRFLEEKSVKMKGRREGKTAVITIWDKDDP